MEVWIKAGQFLAGFSLLVLVHELGHYLFARLFGVRVEKFYLFFNPGFSLLKFTYRGTEYGIGWVPFGGYCKIAGMVDESFDTDALAGEPQPWEFRSKPAWQRLLVMIGGVLMNLVLALTIYIGAGWVWGEQYLSNSELVDGSTFNELGHQIGFRDGDRILSIGGEPIENYAEVFPTMVMEMASQVEVVRDGRPVTVTIPEGYIPRLLESPDFMAPRVRVVVGQVEKQSPAAAAGVREGDRFVAIDGHPAAFGDQYSQELIASHAGGRVELTLLRDTALVTLPVEVSSEGRIGITLTGQPLPVRSMRYSLLESIPAGFRRTGAQVASYWKQLRMIVTPKTEAYKSLGGVIAIGSIFPAQWQWQSFWMVTAFLSIVLAVMNLIPLPVLDGGHVLFLLWEVVSGRKPGERFLMAANTVGAMVLIALLLLANGNDIYRFFIK